MRIQLEGERRERIVRGIQGFFREKFDRELSQFQAEQLVDFLVVELGAPVYNQAIRDAHGFIEGVLQDLEGEFYEPEDD